MIDSGFASGEVALLNQSLSLFVAFIVVLTAGTFLRGVVHIGRDARPAGRFVRDSDETEAPCTTLAATLSTLGLPLLRSRRTFALICLLLVAL